MNPEDYSLFFDEEQHLNQKAQALYVDAMKLNRLVEVPKGVYEHAQNCSYCTVQLYELYEVLEGVNYADLGKHPWLDKGLSKLYLSDKNQDLEAILQQLINDAITIPAYEQMITTIHRNAATSGSETLKVTRPTKEQLCIDSILFQFYSNTNKKFTLILENHKGRVYKTRIAAGNTEHLVEFLPKEKFPSGLYYWKLALRGGSPMVMGKMYISTPNK